MLGAGGVSLGSGGLGAPGSGSGTTVGESVSVSVRSARTPSFIASPNGRDRVVVSTAWIEMADEQRAAQLRAVLDEYGSGHIRPVDRRVRLTGRRYGPAARVRS